MSKKCYKIINITFFNKNFRSPEHALANSLLAQLSTVLRYSVSTPPFDNQNYTIVCVRERHTAGSRLVPNSAMQAHAASLSRRKKL